jgi:hypothetical protein
MDLFNQIISTNTHKSVTVSIEDSMYDYVDDGWEDDFDDIFEAYDETGRGAADSQVLNELIRAATDGKDIPAEEYCELFDRLAEHWNLTTD